VSPIGVYYPGCVSPTVLYPGVSLRLVTHPVPGRLIPLNVRKGEN